MGIFSKAKVKTALKGFSKNVTSPSHTTTSDFFQLQVAFKKYLVPGQSVDIDMSCFSRLAPLPVPTLGRVKIKHHAFFVPFKSVMPSWDDFLTDTPHAGYNTANSGLISSCHCVRPYDLTSVLTSAPYSAAYNPQGTQDDFDPSMFDFCVLSGDTEITRHYYRLTPKGRQIYKILRQLGYDIQNDLTRAADSEQFKVSALPLLALVRCYVDWYYPQMYVGDADYNSLLKILRKDTQPYYQLTTSDIGYIYLYLGSVAFDSDYFTSAFDNPAGPNSGLFSSFDISDVTQVGSPTSSIFPDTGSVTTGSLINPSTPISTIPVSAIGSGNSNFTFLTQYLLDSLHALSDYMKRHQLAGSRALDRFLARFGVTPTITDRSLLLGSFEQSVDFGAVMSNASTDGASLGDYAGQGYSFNGGKFSFYTDKDYGILLILTSVVPVTGYTQGIDRHILHLSKLDFFTPEFDGLGTQAISKAELVSNQLCKVDDESPVTDFVSLNKVYNVPFGFTPRYSEYKKDDDQLTGDFNLIRLSEAGLTTDSWHLYRQFLGGANAESGTLPVHSKDFVFGNNALSTNAQFDRIFDNTTNAADHFVLNYHFEIVSEAPFRSLYDTYDFDDERSGKEITLDTGGVKLN